MRCVLAEYLVRLTSTETWVESIMLNMNNTYARQAHMHTGTHTAVKCFHDSLNTHTACLSTASLQEYPSHSPVSSRSRQKHQQHERLEDFGGKVAIFGAGGNSTLEKKKSTKDVMTGEGGGGA